MSDRGGLLTLEDQGTIFMFSLLFMMVVVTVLYFACVWYRKKQKKEATDDKLRGGQDDHKPIVSKTFSRFSQVDEELTVHIGPLDIDDIDDDGGDKEECPGEDACADGSEQAGNKNTTLDTPSKSVDRPPYLETDM